MIRKDLRVSTGEKVVIYDDVFSKNDVEFFQIFLERSMYTIGTSSCASIQKNKDYFLQSVFSEIDLKNFGIFEKEETKKILEENQLFNINRYWALISTHMSQYQFHVDDQVKGYRTLLYYGNGHWDKNWGGETIICNNKGEVEIAVEFRPNRIVIFDNHLEHRPSPLSLLSYPYRHIFVTQFR